jgi:type IV pilus assembly protein PilY1
MEVSHMNKLLMRFRLPGLLSAFVIVLSLSGADTLAVAPPTPIGIYQSPLTVAVPAHPQVVIAVANSESMDGNLSGAIMTGAGSLGAGLSELWNTPTASPLNFVVPVAFTPPISGGAVATLQPYTVNVAGQFVDNSPSRMNLSKAGLISILNNFMANTDFALMDYATGALQESPTWVYHMSPPGGFSAVAVVPVGSTAIPNPCFGILPADAVGNACAALAPYIPNFTGIGSLPWLLVSATSDDPSINDVLYDWFGMAPVCMVWGGPTPATPFPPNRSLAQYNSGSITETYGTGVGGGCANETGPTNAGYVGFSPQVMYVQRGWSYYTYSENAGTGNLLVGMQTAGVNPTAATVTAKINTFLPYLAPETNNQGTPEIKSSSTQAPTAGLLAGALNYFNTVNPASSNGCAPTRYVVLVTDGLPTLDLGGGAWPPLGSAAAQTPPNGYGVWANFNTPGDGSLISTNDQALTDAISKLAALNAAGIKTYIIGVGGGVNGSNLQAAATLTAMAVAGGTNAFFPANDPAQLTNDMQVILAAIQAGTQSTATAAVNSTSIHAGSVVYQGQFTTSDSAQDWSGNLYAFPVDPATGIVDTLTTDALWNAQSLLDAATPSSRIIATWDPAAGAGTPFEWTAGTPATGIASSTAMGVALSGSPFDPSGADAVNFLRGVQSLSYSNGGPYRPRGHLLGDIVDSAPLYVGGAAGNYSSVAYAAFASTVSSRPAVVYVGANDGMLHAFSATTGQELFAYIPRGVYGNLLNLTSRYYAGDHQFFVDGSPTAGDVLYSGAWHTLLVGGESAGGNSIYALDITNPASFTSEAALSAAVLWDFTDGNMGLTYSRPALANANYGALVVFGNGYNSTAERPYFYALNAQTGAVVAKINLCAAVAGVCNNAAANGLSSVVVTNLNGDLSSNATLIYAGDLQGNLWRIDITNTNPALWTVTVLFQAQDSLGAPQPITSAPAVSLNPNYPRFVGQMVFVGTGQMVGVQDLATTQVQSVYGIYDNNSAPAMPIQRANLVQQTLTNMTINLTAGGTMPGRTVSNNPVNLASSQGWYVDLSLVSGERVVSDPQVDSGAVIVSSVQPAGGTCVGGDYSWLNLFNFATGGSFPSAPLSLTTQVISGLSLGETYASAPRVEIYTNGAVSRAILVTDSGTGADMSLTGTVPIQDYTMYGRAMHRAAWTELR